MPLPSLTHTREDLSSLFERAFDDHGVVLLVGGMDALCDITPNVLVAFGMVPRLYTPCDRMVELKIGHTVIAREDEFEPGAVSAFVKLLAVLNDIRNEPAKAIFKSKAISRDGMSDREFHLLQWGALVKIAESLTEEEINCLPNSVRDHIFDAVKHSVSIHQGERYD